MSIRDRIWYFFYQIGLFRDPSPRHYYLDESLHVTLTTLSKHEGRPVEEFTADLLSAGLSEYYSSDKVWERWQALSTREKDVVALACLEYTNRQIGARLKVSPETVKTHLHNALVKFGVRNRTELRLVLEKWDFSAWEQQK
jgi:DNA-binding CsgD family transcriptional regulator